MVGKLFVISASSGAGKTTLVNALVHRIGASCPLERVITYTSKTHRPGELNGKDYHFLMSHDFKKKIEQGFFLEWSTAYGHYYGSPRHVLDEVKQGKSRIMILDRAGARRVYENVKGAVLIWIDVPCLDVLKDRLMLRGTDSTEQIQKRLILAQEELAQEQAFSLFNYRVLNDHFEDALKRLETIVLKELGML